MLADAIIIVVRSCVKTKDRIVQNRRKSRRLLEHLEAIAPPLRAIENVEFEVAHDETLRKLKDVVELAKALLQKQCNKNYLSQVIASKSIANDFNDINQRIQACMQALHLSVAVLDSVERKRIGDADASEDLEEMQQEVRKMMQNNQDDLRKQIAEMDAGQQGTAREMLTRITETHQTLRRDISDDIKNLIADIAPARAVDSSLPHVDMSIDLIPHAFGENNVLGVGGFGEVRRMRWMSGGGIEVAVKVLLQRRPSPKALAELRKEAEAMHAMRHPNIIQLYGASLRPPHVCLVLEFAPHGSLEYVLQREGAPVTKTQWAERLTFASEIARGLSYLHSRRVLHLDVKSGNVLLFHGGSCRVAKLGDFGLAFVKHETTARSTVATPTTAGTVNWKPPELFRKNGVATRACDVYSYACVMYELASGQIPWEDYGPGEIVGMVSMGDRPDRPDGCVDEFWDLIQRGWAAEPHNCAALVDALETLDAALASGDLSLPATRSERIRTDRRPKVARKYEVSDPRRVSAADPGTDAEMDVDVGSEMDTSAEADVESDGAGAASRSDAREKEARQKRKAADIALLVALRARDPFLAQVWPTGSCSSTWLVPKVWRVDDRGKLTPHGDAALALSFPESVKEFGAVRFENGRLVKLRVLDYRFDADAVARVPAFPPELWHVDALQDLSLGGQLIDYLPAEIGQLAALTRLDLHENRLSNLPPSVSNISGLTHLTVGFNKLTSLPMEIGRLANLQTLDLQSNKLTALPTNIGQLSRLTWLNLSENQLEQMPSVILQLPALTRLSLNGNRIHSLPPEIGQLESGRPPTLTHLDLDNNQLTSLPKEIGRLTALKVLNLNENKLQIVPTEIGGLSSLLQLDLSGNQLTGVPRELGLLSQLTYLNLKSNQLQSLPEQLGLLASLSSLRIDCNPMRNLPDSMNELIKTGNLRYVNGKQVGNTRGGCCIVS